MLKKTSLILLLTLSAWVNQSRAEEAFLFRNAAAPIEDRVNDVLRRLTLEEKATLCHGETGNAPEERFYSGGVPRLGIERISFRDGPVGIRTFDKSATTALPSTIALACTWDVNAATDYAHVLADEMHGSGRQILFGPGVNLMRDPRGGRNFEYLGEDPFLGGTLAVAYIRALQERGIAADAKHLVANDYETRRHFTSANLDERTLREMHFLPFEMAVRDGHVWSVMTANSLVNGTHVSANHDVLQTLLKDRMGFDGVVLTDWRAAYDTVPTALAGTDMTTGLCAYVFGEGHLLEAVRQGQVPETLLDDKARRILRLYARTRRLDPVKPIPKELLDTPEHRAVARRIAADGIVLLKNEKSLLPLDAAKLKSVFVTGPGTDYVAFGRGSGQVFSAFRTTPMQGLRNALGGGVSFHQVAWPEPNASRGPSNKAASNVEFSADDLAAAKTADVVIFFAADVPHGEGTDLADLELPGGQAAAISALAKQNSRVIVVVQSGQPVLLEPFADRVSAILVGWYLGQSAGDAIADVLIGKVAPSGRLSATFARRTADYPLESLGLWPPRAIIDPKTWDAGVKAQDRKATYGMAADYKEGVFIGYRWFDAKKIEPLFPFGHGLSYSTFDFSALKVEGAGSALRVTCKVKNTGKVASAEVVQLYIAPPAQSRVDRPARELKGYAKVFLQPGEAQIVEIKLRPSALCYFNSDNHNWRADAGTYEIEVGASSRDIRVRSPFQLKQELVQEWY